MASTLRKGRARTAGARNFGPRFGTHNAHAIATEELVRWIRAQRAAGTPYKDLAARTGLAYPTVYAIANRLTWKHVA